MGTAFGYAPIGYESLLRGLNKLEANPTALAADLDANWEVLAEPIQNVMRRYGLEKPYVQLKKLTRGKRITAARLARFIDELAIPAAAKKELRAMTPASYTGKAAQLAKRIGKGGIGGIGHHFPAIPTSSSPGRRGSRMHRAPDHSATTASHQHSPQE